MNTPCQDDPEKWFSNDVEERAQAMSDCLDCPALTWCRKLADADEPGYGVWGGKDYSPNPAVRTFGYCQRCGECYQTSRGTTTAPKVCGWCGSQFRRTTNITLRQWESREFCSVRCGARANGAARSAAVLARKKAS